MENEDLYVKNKLQIIGHKFSEHILLFRTNSGRAIFQTQKKIRNLTNKVFEQTTQKSNKIFELF